MKKKDLVERFEKINVWKKGGQRAPHKPLLLLMALGAVARGEKRLKSFAELSPVLAELLMEFGPSRKSHHPEYPFWRLQNDGIWELQNIDGLDMRTGSSDAKKSELLRANVTGGFTGEVFDCLNNNRSSVQTIALGLLGGHFTENYFDDILQAVGLDFQTDLVISKRRDPNFRKEVLRAYEYRCAVCGGDVRLENTILALEAAHIKWHNAHGPDSVNNGLALRSLHHKLFDRGAFTVAGDSREVLVSELVNGGPSAYDWLFRYHGQPVAGPQRDSYMPESAFLNWHMKEVFRGPGRDRFSEIAADPGI